MHQRFPHPVKNGSLYSGDLRVCSWVALVTAETWALCRLETTEGFVGEWT